MSVQQSLFNIKIWKSLHLFLKACLFFLYDSYSAACVSINCILSIRFLIQYVGKMSIKYCYKQSVKSFLQVICKSLLHLFLFWASDKCGIVVLMKINIRAGSKHGFLRYDLLMNLQNAGVEIL